MDNHLTNIKLFFESLDARKLSELSSIYSTNASFKDPFHEVSGIEAITQIFQKMFDQLNDPHFQVIEVQGNDESAAILWDFEFSFKHWNSAAQSFRGVSWLYFDADGKIIKHVDYWDPSAGIYEKLPILGSFMRGLKRLA